MAERRAGEAAELCRKLVSGNDTSVEPLLLLARALQQQGHFDAMLALAERALALDGRHRGAELQFVEACIYCGLHDRATLRLNNMEARAQNDAGLLQHVAALYAHNASHADAHRCYQRALELQPDDSRTLYNFAASCVAVGDIDAAESAYSRVIGANPADHDAWQNRSVLRRQSTEDNHIEGLQQALASLPTGAAGEAPLCYALAKEHEDLGAYKVSFDFLSRGAHSRRRRLRYNVQTDIDVMQKITETFDTAYASQPAAKAPLGPIFVLGLPRSGTTLVDRILSSHSEVESLGEINDFALTLTRLGRSTEKNALLEASASISPENLGAAYLQSVASYGGSSQYFIDKTPANFLYIGLIAKALPGAHIIHVHRHPVDSCLGMYRTLFRMGYPFSYDLDDVGRYYAAYSQLMQHWYAVFPERVFDVSYEALVNDQDGVTRNLLAHCGLNFEEACLAFDRNKAPVATASAAQVRRPLYRDAVNRWRRYENELAPLIVRLQADGIEI